MFTDKKIYTYLKNPLNKYFRFIVNSSHTVKKTIDIINVDNNCIVYTRATLTNSCNGMSKLIKKVLNSNFLF